MNSAQCGAGVAAILSRASDASFAYSPADTSPRNNRQLPRRLLRLLPLVLLRQQVQVVALVLLAPAAVRVVVLDADKAHRPQRSIPRRIRS